MSDFEELRDPILLPPRSERGCPPGEWWIELVSGTPSASERGKLLDHLAACPDCAAEVRALREVAAWSGTARPEHRRYSSSLAAAAVAAVVLLPFFAFVTSRDMSPETAIVRGTEPENARILPSDGEVLDTPPAAFRWSAVDGAREYRVQLLDGEGSLLWTSPPRRDPIAPLPQEIRQRLGPGKTYLWRVEILLDGDRRTTPTYEFRMAQ
jgi:hypothetical protein